MELEHQTPAVEYDSRVDSNSVAVPANDVSLKIGKILI